MIKKKIDELKKLIRIKGLSPEKTAWSIAVAIGTVFLPLPGIQLIAVLPICLTLRLNIPIVYLVNWLNNPLSIAPISFFSFWVGSQLIKIVSLGTLQEQQLNTMQELLDQIKLSQWSWSRIQSIDWSRFHWEEYSHLIEGLLFPYLIGSMFIVLVLPFLVYPFILGAVKKMNQKK